MRIKSSGQSHSLYRYGGAVDSKTVEVKIGSVPVGTSPDSISADLLDDLTPKEVRELRDFLDGAHTEYICQRLCALAIEIGSAVDLVTEKLDVKTSQDLTVSISGMQAALRRVDKQRKGLAVLSPQPN